MAYLRPFESRFVFGKEVTSHGILHMHVTARGAMLPHHIMQHMQIALVVVSIAAIFLSEMADRRKVAGEKPGLWLTVAFWYTCLPCIFRHAPVHVATRDLAG